MPLTKVAVTGASSASGIWIGKSFQDKNWEVHALCSQTENTYTGLKARRIAWLKKISQVSFALRAEKDTLAPWILANKPTIWIHHHHHMENYRTPEFNLAQARREGIPPLKAIVTALREVDCKGIIYSGSFFEPGEGGDQNFGISSSYSLSKKEVGKELEKIAAAVGIPFSKIVIPDPTGPLESIDRFLPMALNAAKNGVTFELRSPDSISDHIALQDLAEVYVGVAEKLLIGIQDTYRPSGEICTNDEWLAKINGNLLKKLGYTLKVRKTDGIATVPENRWNSKTKKRDINWNDFWENYLHFQQSGEPWRKKPHE
jgi:UDP-glucose 4-epimerase